VLDRQGRTSRVLYTVGALRRGELWESTAAAEIRTQAADVASELCRSLDDTSRTARRIDIV
jgi:hypothetical protein